MNTPSLCRRKPNVSRRLTFPLSHLLCFAALLLTPAFCLLTSGTPAYDGRDIVISGATVTIDGPHAFHSLLLTHCAMLTHSLEPNLTAPIAPTPPGFARTLRA